jgi:SAM-dependent methyltransferase
MSDTSQYVERPAAGLLRKTLIACPVCETRSYHVKFTDELGDKLALVDYDFKPETQKVYQIVSCDCCNFIYTNPVPDLGPAYTDNVDQVYLSTSEQRKRTAERDVQRLQARIKSGRVLDVGCAVGIFLDAATAAGYQTEGIELSQWARTEASRRHTVYDKTLGELGWKDQFDIITLWGVIEHLQDPAGEMKLVLDALKPGGHVFLYTGDADSSLARIMGRRWYWYMGMHLMYFSGKTLRQLLTRLGFIDVRYELHTSYFSLGSLAISLRRYKILLPIVWLLQRPFLVNRMIALTLPGEMLMVARKPAG